MLLASTVLTASLWAQPSPPPAAGVPSGQGRSRGGAPASPAYIAAPRTDPNSQIAHQQLLEKAKKGGIDLYFLGDSITRRWATTDVQYKDFLANFTENFYGWNAGNFGWGADSVQHVLWRIENGELDGVNPKVIVLLAGTNNVSGQPYEGRAEEVTRGLKAVVAVCQAKAPNATIVITGILARSTATAMPDINRINENLAQFADGKKVRFLNVNAQLTGPDGKLLDGMMVDGLHPAVKGYQVWADGLKPVLTELLGPRAKTDTAPPHTGDPSAAARNAAPAPAPIPAAR